MDVYKAHSMLMDVAAAAGFKPGDLFSAEMIVQSLLKHGSDEAHGEAIEIVEDIADMGLGDIESEHRDIIARCRAAVKKWEAA